MHLGLAFTMRSPSWGPPTPDLYAAALDMAGWADSLGFETVGLSEHHNTPDGYLPSPIVLAAGIGARTSGIDIKLSVVLATLMHPLHLAEDLAVADLVANGRLRVTLGAGFRKEESIPFGVNWKRRPSLMVETVETLRAAWTGEPFEFRGSTVQVLPRPARPGGPRSPWRAHRRDRRAGRRRSASATNRSASTSTSCTSPSWPGSASPRPPPRPGEGIDPLPGFVAVAHDPAAYWAEVGPHVLHNENEYASYARRKDLTPFQAATDPDELIHRGAARVYTPEELVATCRAMGPDGVLRFNPLEGGVPPEVGWRSLRLFETEVLPHI